MRGFIGTFILAINSKLASLKDTLVHSWKTNGKFTIHPFQSLHSRHLLPLSIGDYAARFSLELVLMAITIIAVWANFATISHATAANPDQSVIFSFLKARPDLNRKLVSQADTTTIFSKSDKRIALASQSPFGVVLAAQTSDSKSRATSASTMQDDVIVKTNPSDTQGVARDGFTTYQVQSGDTIINIAASFGVSPQTVMMENKISDDRQLKAGQELTILPTTGISYTITESDSMESILKKYKVSEDDFLDANNIESFEDLAIGTDIVIPLQNVVLPTPAKQTPKFVKDETGKVALKQAKTPADFLGAAANFIWPTPVRTITQGYSSRHTGLDISDSKREPIYAVADGFVEISGFQANGYGNTIIINHGNGLKTRYAHASEIFVSAGDYVTRGQTIAKQGRSGRVRGVTGIHLHFEVILNGKRVNPLAYVRP